MLIFHGVRHAYFVNEILLIIFSCPPLVSICICKHSNTIIFHDGIRELILDSCHQPISRSPGWCRNAHPLPAAVQCECLRWVSLLAGPCVWNVRTGPRLGEEGTIFSLSDLYFHLNFLLPTSDRQNLRSQNKGFFIAK